MERMELKERQIDFLGLQLHDLTMAETLAFVGNAAQGDRFARILTLNAEIAYNAWQDEELTALVNTADLVTADGAGILWAAEHLGLPVREKVTGIDLLQQLVAAAADGHLRFFFFGAVEGVAQAAAEKLRAQYPDLAIVGCRNGYFDDSESPAIAAEIAACGADVLICAMGAPRQDRWLRDFGPLCGAKVGIGVGGSLDVIAGNVKRAPVFFQKHGVEWLYRLAREPWRAKRMMTLPRFMKRVKKLAKNQ